MMRILETVKRVPGGLMVLPLFLGAAINTLDSQHLPIVQSALKAIGTEPTKSGHYELLHVGGFTTALFKTGALCLIALFLFCSASQMNLRIGRRALKKGIILTLSKYLIGLAVGYSFWLFYGHQTGLLGLSALAIIAAMTNSNGGMFVALTGQYGNRSDSGAIAMLSLNDGPFFTMIALGLMGDVLPVAAFLAVLLPIGLGMLLGNLDPDIRAFLRPGETLTIPFFAFALGASSMNLAVFTKLDTLVGGVTLGVLTTVLTGFGGILALRLFREKSGIAGMAEGSTAGNAVQTPLAITTAAQGTAMYETFKGLESQATAQISIACMTTAILCPIAVIMVNRWQLARGIDGKLEPEDVRSTMQERVPLDAEMAP